MYSVHSHMHTKLLPHNNVYIQHWCIHTYINTRNSTIFCHLLHFHRLQFFYLKLIEILCLPPSPLLVFTAKNLYQLNFCFSFFTFPPRLCVCVCCLFCVLIIDLWYLFFLMVFFLITYGAVSGRSKILATVVRNKKQ